ncbi:hypothetical protein ACFQ14_03080 [Pseudahrensia aquimaris]|uniref:DUF423 domain-containing protein n=1 Tax=Pseudahrensia aquimaris TaxID=744461 RepID=A0ABW3FCU4_9HYPH
MTYAKIGAALFGVWGVMHLGAAWQVAALGGALEAGEVQGRLFQTAFFLAFFALLAIVTARFNWQNNRAAFWINAIGTSAADIPFLLFLVAPGIIGPPANFAGPLVWVLALGFSAFGLRRS